MSRLTPILRAGTPGEGVDAPVRPLTEHEIRCTRAVVRRWCQDRAREEEQRLLVALGIEEDR